MSRQPHTEFRKGQRVIVLFRDGTHYIGKYVDKFRNGIEVDDHKFLTMHIRQVGIYRDSSQSATPKEGKL